MTAHTCKWMAIIHITIAVVIIVILCAIITSCARPMVQPPSTPLPGPEPSIETTPSATGPKIKVMLDVPTPAYRTYIPMVHKAVVDMGVFFPPSGVSPTDWTFLRNTGFTLARANYFAPHNWQDWSQYLDSCQALGMKLLCSIGEEMMPVNSTSWYAMVDSIASHPALLGIEFYDEPHLNLDLRQKYPVQSYLDAAQRFNTRYVGQTVLMSVQSGASRAAPLEDVRKYSRFMGFVAYDHYSFPEYADQYYEQWSYSTWMISVSEGRPLHAVLQAHARQGQTPSRAILLAEARGAVAAGAVAIWWWYWPDNAPHVNSPLWSDIVAVSSQVMERPHLNFQ